MPGAGAVGEAFVRLATNRKKLKLNLRETNLDSEATTVFSDKVLASLVNVSNTLSCEINLCVDDNPLGHNGLSAIFRMLSNENCPVTRLGLQSTVHTSNTHDLTPCLNKSSLNSTTIYLNLCRNLLHGNNIFILADIIQCCLSLEILYCHECRITSKDIITLLTHLKYHNIQRNCLKCWFLGINSIDDDAVTALITYLPSVFPCIEYINLYDNLVSTETVNRLKEFLEVRLYIMKICIASSFEYYYSPELHFFSYILGNKTTLILVINIAMYGRLRTTLYCLGSFATSSERRTYHIII